MYLKKERDLKGNAINGNKILQEYEKEKKTKKKKTKQTKSISKHCCFFQNNYINLIFYFLCRASRICS